MTHYLVQGDTASQLKAVISRLDTGSILDLTSKTVKLYFRKKGDTIFLFSIVGELTDAENGEVLFDFGTNLEDIAAGFYEGEIELTNSDATIESIYEILSFQVRADF